MEQAMNNQTTSVPLDGNCSRCGKSMRFKASDGEWDEMVTVDFVTTAQSIWGTHRHVHGEFCQACIKDILGQFATIVDLESIQDRTISAPSPYRVYQPSQEPEPSARATAYGRASSPVEGYSASAELTPEGKAKLEEMIISMLEACKAPDYDAPDSTIEPVIFESPPTPSTSIPAANECACCKQSISDDVAWQDRLTLSYRGGYFSVFMDECQVICTLCPACFFQIFGKHLSVKSNQGHADN